MRDEEKHEENHIRRRCTEVAVITYEAHVWEQLASAVLPSHDLTCGIAFISDATSSGSNMHVSSAT